MTKLRLFRSSSRTARSRAARIFLTPVTAVSLILAALPGNPESAASSDRNASQGFRPPATLPLTSFYDTPHPLSPGKPGELIRSEAIDQYNLPYELSALRILYHSRTASGEDVAVSAVVLIPDGKPPASGWPVIAWAHEFRGAARAMRSLTDEESRRWADPCDVRQSRLCGGGDRLFRVGSRFRQAGAGHAIERVGCDLFGRGGARGCEGDRA